MMTKTVYGS